LADNSASGSQERIWSALPDFVWRDRTERVLSLSTGAGSLLKTMLWLILSISRFRKGGARFWLLSRTRMRLEIPQLNLAVAWGGILLAFLSGLWLGLNFHRPDWLGGYASHQRRLYRLGHISLFGLGATNLLFYFTALILPAASLGVTTAAWGFMVGA